MSYFDPDVQHLADLLRDFSTSLQLPGTPVSQLRDEANALCQAVRDVAQKHGVAHE